jgi:transposase
MSHKLNSAIAVIGIDIGKNSFHIVGHDKRGAIMLRQKWSRGQVETRLANLPPCLIGMEACVGAHHLSRKLQMLGHDARLMPAKYVRPYSKPQGDGVARPAFAGAILAKRTERRDRPPCILAKRTQPPSLAFARTRACG